MKKRKKLTPKQEKRNQLVEANIGLSTYFADQFQASRMEYADLVQEAHMGLIDAAEKFDPDRGTKFSTYARWHIVKRVMDAIHNRNEIVRTPRRRPSHICSSLDETRVMEMPDETPHISEQMDEAAMVEAVRACIKELPSREGIVVRLRRGVNTDALTLAKIGDILGVTAERVRQIQKSGEEKLRALLAERSILRDYGADTTGHPKEPVQNPDSETDPS
jgi:RNA polymerase sigma factor (sigma-70 family)